LPSASHQFPVVDELVVVVLGTLVSVVIGALVGVVEDILFDIVVDSLVGVGIVVLDVEQDTSTVVKAISTLKANQVTLFFNFLLLI
jgi:hypothetical protein